MLVFVKSNSLKGPLNINSHEYDGFIIVTNSDPNAGLCALMTYALNGVRYALERNLIPVISFDKSSTGLIYSKVHGENI